MITEPIASRLASLALGCIQKEFPNRPDQTLNSADDLQRPRALHPAFYGCFDWHSAVHGHWMLVRLLRVFPKMDQSAAIRAALSQNLSEENLLAEAAYLKRPGTDGFERPYGWAWLLKLAEELQTRNDVDASRWTLYLKPLAAAIVDRYMNFFPKLTYPLRTGTHSNTAFGLAFALDFARTANEQTLANLIQERSSTYFARDRDYPAQLEPGGEDFFSACLMEADLMRRVMDRVEFTKWFREFLPDLYRGAPERLLEPAAVTDRTDGRLVHLDGLNLSRAWCMQSIVGALPNDSPEQARLASAARRHAEVGLRHVASGNYMGDHWLASFAVYMGFTFRSLEP